MNFSDTVSGVQYTNRVIFANPWTAFDLLHQDIINGNGTNIVWCGWNAQDKTNTAKNVVIDKGRITNLPVALPVGTAAVTVTFNAPLFVQNDVLRVGDEILQVASANGNQCVLWRAVWGSPSSAHASNAVIYALSPLLVKNIQPWGAAHLIAQATTPLIQALGSHSFQIISAPVLFDDEIDTKKPTKFVALTANLANCLVVNANLVYYSDPGNEAFKEHFESVVPGATAIDVWESYHCRYGEIHCATATIRSLPPSPAWWEQNAIKTKWENEK